jgi:hypothetical protein
MTYVQLLYLNTSSVLDQALQGKLSLQDFLENEKEIVRMSGESDSNPFQIITIAPFIKYFFSMMHEWLGKKNNDSLISLIQIYNGTHAYEHNGILEPLNRKLKTSPKWYLQTLETAEAAVQKSELEPGSLEKIGYLLRNIPMDAAVGFVSQLTLKKILFNFDPSLENSKKEKIQKEIKPLLDYLKGESSLSYNLKIRGMYIVFDVETKNERSSL